MPVAFSEVLQAEAYHDGDCILIRNDRTERIVEHTRKSIPGTLRLVDDFRGFLAAAAEIMNGQVIVTFGDSTTANVSNWAYTLADRHLRGGNAVVVNLADWGRSSENHTAVLEFCLAWFGSTRATDVQVVLMLGLRDLHDRIRYFNDFLNGGRDSVLSDAEELLQSHRYGGELARLARTVPADWDEAIRSVPGRILAGARIMERLCMEASVPWLAMIEPSSYSDCSPGYLAELRRRYAADSEAAGTSFQAWCRDRQYKPDPSVLGPRDHRPFLDELRRTWRVAQGERRYHGNYPDLSGLFHDVAECCFLEQFDAVHYNQLGSTLIADRVAAMLNIVATAPAMAGALLPRFQC